MPRRRAYLRRARHWIANRGWRGFVQQVLWRAKLRFQGKPVPGREGPDKGPHPFDRDYNVDTTGLVWGEALDDPAPGTSDTRYWATGYYGISPSAFNAALDHLALDWTRFTFVDIGCGKGRALLLATRLPFRALLGIELSSELAAIARRNLETFTPPWRKPQPPPTVLTADAAAAPFPEGPLVLFLYHPFAAPVMRRFLDHVLACARACPREIYLLYANPELAPMLDKTPDLMRLWELWTTMTPQETAADRFSSSEEHTIAYRVQPETKKLSRALHRN